MTSILASMATARFNPLLPERLPEKGRPDGSLRLPRLDRAEP
jgi:hypothetical protein